MKILLTIILAFTITTSCVTETFMVEDSTWKTCTIRCGKRKLKHLGYRVSYSYVYFQSTITDIICECFDGYRYMMAPSGKYNNDEWEEY